MGHDADTRRGDTFRGKPVANGDRTAGGELFLVSTGVRVIGVALHENVEFGTLAQPLGLPRDHGTGAAAEFGAAGAEEYAIANAVRNSSCGLAKRTTVVRQPDTSGRGGAARAADGCGAVARRAA